MFHPFGYSEFRSRHMCVMVLLQRGGGVVERWRVISVMQSPVRTIMRHGIATAGGSCRKMPILSLVSHG